MPMKQAVKYIAIGFFGCLLFIIGEMYAQYYYVQPKFNRVEPIGTIYSTKTKQIPGFTKTLAVHQINTPAKAKTKQRDFNAFEIDLISGDSGALFVAHDGNEAKNKISFEDIVKQIEDTPNFIFWFDLKTELTENNINEIVEVAAKYGLKQQHLMFEIGLDVGEKTLPVLKKYNLPVLLRTIPGFEYDNGSPKKREELNRKMQETIELFEPFAIMGTVKRYPYLRAYFPDTAKVIQYPSVRMPSLKKVFLVRKMIKEPDIKIILIDEFRVFPL